MNHAATRGNLVSFPYAFPDKGMHRLWVQMKHGGRVYIGVFDVQVE